MMKRTRKREVARARAWHALLLDQERAGEHADTERFLADCIVSPGPGALVFGRMLTPRGWQWVGLPIERALTHLSIVGASGGGKSMLGLALFIQLHLYHPDVVKIIIDKKNEFSGWLLNTVLPALTTDPRLVHVIQPHGARIGGHVFLPTLRLSEAQPGLSKELQTLLIVESIQAALGDLGGLRMNHVLARLVQLCIERDLPLTRIRTWLQLPATFSRDAQHSADPLLRAFAAQLPHEPRSTLDGLASRVGQLFFQREAQLCLSAPRCFNLRRAIQQPGTVIIFDIADPSAASERALTFWSSSLTSLLTSALLSRPVDANTPHVVVFGEEWQSALSASQAHSFMRLSALARARRVSVWTLNQSRAQLAQVDPHLPSILRTNATVEVSFRSAPEDSFALSPPTLDPAEARAFAQRLTRLKRREAAFWVKEFGPQIIRSPRIDLAALQRRADAADPALRHAILRGMDSERQDVLEAHLANEERTCVPQRLPTSTPSNTDHRFPRLG